MKFYLRVINPVIALIVFILCFWAATAGDGFNLAGLVIGGMSTYFFAKGLFTSCSLLILGRILLEIISYSEKQNALTYKKYEKLYSLSFGVVTLGLLIGLFLSHGFDSNEKTSINYEEIQDPPSLKIVDIHRITESERLKYSGRIVNESKTDWTTIKIEGSLFIKGILSEKTEVRINSLEASKETGLIVNFNDFSSDGVSDSSDIRFSIKASKKQNNRGDGCKENTDE